MHNEKMQRGRKKNDMDKDFMRVKEQDVKTGSIM